MTDQRPRTVDIRIPMLALGPVPGLSGPWAALAGRGRARLVARWARRLAVAAGPYATFARQRPEVELMLTLPARHVGRVDAHDATIRAALVAAVRAGFAAGTGYPPDPSRITITIDYDTATVHAYGDTALCMRKDYTP